MGIADSTIRRNSLKTNAIPPWKSKSILSWIIAVLLFLAFCATPTTSVFTLLISYVFWSVLNDLLNRHNAWLAAILFAASLISLYTQPSTIGGIVSIGLAWMSISQGMREGLL